MAALDLQCDLSLAESWAHPRCGPLPLGNLADLRPPSHLLVGALPDSAVGQDILEFENSFGVVSGAGESHCQVISNLGRQRTARQQLIRLWYGSAFP